MTIFRFLAILLMLAVAGAAPAGSPVAADSRHQYWVCVVSTYSSIVNGKRREERCRANTAYSEPPCLEFYVEFAGTQGIRPGNPYRGKTGENSTEHIEIEQAVEGYTYFHTIDRLDDRWIYQGKCDYFEAPSDDKIYMDHGLTVPR